MRLNEEAVASSSEGFDTSKKAYIAESNLGIIFDTLSKSFYSDPIGSIIREYSNNSIDAFIAAGKEPKPIIRFNMSNRSIHFIDEGTGLNPEQMDRIFLSFGESTKRNTDNQIGSFGLGSKSALSYTPSFYIDTVVDGIEYHYLFSKTGPVPELDLLVSYPSERPTGTDVWFILKPSAYTSFDSELNKFELAISRQLPYLESVRYEGFKEISNEFTLFQGEHFIHRPNVDLHGGYLHICFGHNVYPINFTELGIHPIPFQGALRFGIDSGLRVTPNREQLIYDDRVKTIIKDKIALLKAELQQKYNESDLGYDSILTFLKKRNEDAFISGPGYSLSLKGLGVSSAWLYKPVQDLNLKVPSSLDTVFSQYEVRDTSRRGYGRWHDVVTYPPNKIYLAHQVSYSPSKNSVIKDHAEAILFPDRSFVVTDKLISAFYGDKIKCIHERDPDTNLLITQIEDNGIDWKAEIEFFLALVKEEIEQAFSNYDEIVVPKKERSYSYKDKGEVSVRINGGDQRYITMDRLEKVARHVILVDSNEERLTFWNLIRSTYGNEKQHVTVNKKTKKKQTNWCTPLIAVITTTKGDLRKIHKLRNIQTIDWFFTQPMWPKLVEQDAINRVLAVRSKICNTLKILKPGFLAELERLHYAQRQVCHIDLYLERYPIPVTEHPLLAKLEQISRDYPGIEELADNYRTNKWAKHHIAVSKLMRLYKQQVERCQQKNNL